MLALREEFRAAAGGELPQRSAGEFGTFFLCNMEDPDLVILPTHRLVHALPSVDPAALLERAKEYFTISTLEKGATNAALLKKELARLAEIRTTFAMVVPNNETAWLLGTRVEPEDVGMTGHRSVLHLDVTVLHALVLERLLGIDRAAQEAQQNLSYVKDTADALARMQRGEAQLGFIMNPTRVEQVRHVADAGEVMPQKSTFFYPKIASGLVINPVDPDEDLDRPY